MTRQHLLEFLITIIFCNIVAVACMTNYSSNVNVPTASFDSSAVSTSTSPTGPPTAITMETQTDDMTNQLDNTSTPEELNNGFDAILPPLADSLIAYDIVFGHSVPNCELPCWQGLIVGESDKADIQSVFENVFGFQGYDVFQNDVLSKVEETISVSHGWPLDDPGDSFFVGMQLNEELDVLNFVELSWSGDGFSKYVNPMLVYQQLGSPMAVLVSIDQTELADYVSLNLNLLYPESITFVFGYLVDITYPDDSQAQKTLRLCLSDQSRHGGVLDIGKSVFGEWDYSSYQPFEDVFVSNYADSIERILNGEDVCWTTEF